MVISHGALTGSSWKQYWQYNQVFFFLNKIKKKVVLNEGQLLWGIFFSKPTNPSWKELTHNENWLFKPDKDNPHSLGMLWEGSKWYRTLWTDICCFLLCNIIMWHADRMCDHGSPPPKFTSIKSGLKSSPEYAKWLWHQSILVYLLQIMSNG